MARKFKVSVLAPDRVFFDGETELMILTGTEGMFGVMYDRQPSVVPLAIGSIKLKNDDGTYSVAASGSGLFTMRDSEATVLIDSAEWIDEIDLDRATEAKKRAEERLSKSNEGIDFIRAEAALRRAINRIKLGERGR